VCALSLEAEVGVEDQGAALIGVSCVVLPERTGTEVEGLEWCGEVDRKTYTVDTVQERRTRRELTAGLSGLPLAVSCGAELEWPSISLRKRDCLGERVVHGVVLAWVEGGAALSGIPCVGVQDAYLRVLALGEIDGRACLPGVCPVASGDVVRRATT